MPVIHIQHIGVQEGATFFLPETKGAEIHQSVAPLETEKVIVKNYPNSFRETELLDYLKEKSISNLVICGMMTDVCVSSTTRASMDFGFHNTIITDAVTTRDRELNGKVIPAEQITESFLVGLNALGGLYAALETSESYIKQYWNNMGSFPSFEKNILKYVDLSEDELAHFISCYTLETVEKNRVILNEGEVC